MSPITWAVVLLAGAAGVQSLGSDTSVSSWPSLVQVEDLIGIVWLQHCGGSLINSYYVLSAAICVRTNNLNNRRFRAGATQRGVGGQVVEPREIFIHESYGELGNDGNIALARTRSPFILGSDVQQAQILGQGIELPVNLVVTIVGWGSTGGSFNDQLKELELRVHNNEDCKNKYLDAYYPQIITENMFCAGLTYNSGRDIDGRDLGTPIFYEKVTVGVTSFGTSFNSDNEFPIVATAISSYTSWIVDQASQI